jgi:hypothetical protein
MTPVRSYIREAAILDVPSHESLAIPSQSFAPTADDIAEQWYARYCAERTTS